MTLELRCYAYRSGDAWEAICTDLDIATFAASLEEVKQSLAICIEMYVEGVGELPAAERPRLLARKAPWHVRAKLAALAWLSDLRNDAHQGLRFTLQCDPPRAFLV